MDPLTLLAGAVGPVSGLVDSLVYTQQEQQRDAVNAEMARSQAALAAAQQTTAAAKVRAEEVRAESMQRTVIIAAGAGVAVVALLVLLR